MFICFLFLHKSMIMHHLGKHDLKSLGWKKVTILHGCEHKKQRCRNLTQPTVRIKLVLFYFEM